MEKQLNVLMLTTSFPRYRGDGAGSFVYHLGRGLSRAGVSVDILAPHDPGTKYNEVLGGLNIFRFPYFFPPSYQKLCYGSGILKNMKGSPIAALQVPCLISTEAFFAFAKIVAKSYDLVHAHWIFPQGFVALLLKAISGIPFVATVHGSDVYGLKAPLLKMMNATVINRSDRCTANSRSTAKMARSVSGRKDVDLIPMGVDTDLFKTVQQSNGLRGDDRKDEKIILFVGRLIEFKGVEYLLRSIPEVLRRFSRLRAVIVGSGPQEGYLRNLTRKLGLENHVIFSGSVPQVELPKFYSAADVFVLPSTVIDKGETEGLGVVLLEAMACGTPVIGTSVGGIPDIIRDGQTGLLVKQKDPEDLASKINQVLMDDDLRRGLVGRGMDFVVNNFSWEIVAEKFLRLYRELLEAPGAKVSERM